jgi:hypothetical protein
MNKSIKEGYDRVSSIAGAFTCYSKIPPTFLENARIRGENVHELIKSYLQDTPSTIARIQEYEGYLVSLEKFWSTLVNPEIVMIEERLYAHVLKITGQVDLIIKDPILGHILIDWKCTYAAGKHWAIQAAGYEYLVRTGVTENDQRPAIAVDTIFFVRLDKKGNPPEIIEYKADMNLFMKAYDMYRMFFKDAKCNLFEMD